MQKNLQGEGVAVREKGEWARGGRDGCQTMPVWPHEGGRRRWSGGYESLICNPVRRGIQPGFWEPIRGVPVWQEWTCLMIVAVFTHWPEQSVESGISTQMDSVHSSRDSHQLGFSRWEIWVVHFYGHYNDGETGQHLDRVIKIDITHEEHTSIMCF